MNITEETNDYFSTTDKIKSGGIIIRYPQFKLGEGPDLENECCNANSGPTEKSNFISYMDKEFNNADWNDQQVWDSLKDKFRVENLKPVKIKSPFSLPTEEEVKKAMEGYNEKYYYATTSPSMIMIHRKPGVYAEDILKDKLRTTPDRGIKKVSKVFRVNWSKVFKRAWWLWK